MSIVNAHELQHWLQQTQCKSHSRAELRLRCMVAWRLLLLALHPSTVLVLDCTSWWCHAQYLLLKLNLADALRAAQSDSTNPRMVSQPKGLVNPLWQWPTLLVDFRKTRGNARGNPHHHPLTLTLTLTPKPLTLTRSCRRPKCMVGLARRATTPGRAIHPASHHAHDKGARGRGPYYGEWDPPW